MNFLINRFLLVVLCYVFTCKNIKYDYSLPVPEQHPQHSHEKYFFANTAAAAATMTAITINFFITSVSPFEF